MACTDNNTDHCTVQSYVIIAGKKEAFSLLPKILVDLTCVPAMVQNRGTGKMCLVRPPASGASSMVRADNPAENQSGC